MGALKKQNFGPSRSDSDWRAAKARKCFAGFIFVCSRSTIPDLDRGIFGLPSYYEGRVRNIRKGMPLFLFNHSDRCLYGVFKAASDGGYNIDPHAWENMEHSNSWRCTNPVSKLPAQVRVTISARSPALLEEESFRPILDYVEGPNFRLELTEAQVQQLLRLFDAANPAERKFLAERNRVSQNVTRDPESPRSTAKSDSDSHSDCSSRGLNSCEDEWSEEAVCENVHYQQGDDEIAVSKRLRHISLDECQHLTGVETSAQRFHAANDAQAPTPTAALPQIFDFTPALIEALHFNILRFARRTRPSQEIQLRVEAAIDCVRNGVKMVWPEADVEVFGSFATGLCLQHSDVDLVVIDAPPITSADGLSLSQASAFLIRKLAAALRMYEWCESIKPLDTASMPVLKCLCRPRGSSTDAPTTISSIAVDITIGGMRDSYYSWNPALQVLDTADHAQTPGKFSTRHTGGAAREYVLHKIQELPALAPLVLLLKSFLHHRNLSNVYSGGLGSFSLTLLVAFFLEQVGATRDVSSSDDFSTPHTSPSASCSSSDLLGDATSSSGSFGASNGIGESDYSAHSLGERYVRRASDAIERVLSLWDRNGSQTLGSLLVGFLYTFGYRDLSCVKIVLKGINGCPGGFLKRDDRHVALWIDDPLRPGVNLGAGSFGMVHVQKAFEELIRALTKRGMFISSLQCEEKGCQDLAALSPLQCEEKDCQDLAALSKLAHIGCITCTSDVL